MSGIKGDEDEQPARSKASHEQLDKILQKNRGKKTHRAVLLPPL